MKKLLVFVVILILCILSELFYLSVKASYYVNRPINWYLLYACIVAFMLLVVVMFWPLILSYFKPKSKNTVAGKTVSRYQDRLVQLARNHGKR